MKFKESLSKARELRIEDARIRKELLECVCCYNEECLLEEMLPCNGG